MRALIPLLFLLAGLGCSIPGEWGDPCLDEDDCEEQLICDIHEEVGICTPEHMHDDDDSADPWGLPD